MMLEDLGKKIKVKTQPEKSILKYHIITKKALVNSLKITISSIMILALVLTGSAYFLSTHPSYATASNPFSSMKGPTGFPCSTNNQCLSNFCTSQGKCGYAGTVSTPLKVTTTPPKPTTHTTTNVTKPTTPSTTPTIPAAPPAPNPACQQVKTILSNAQYSSYIIAKVMTAMSCS